MQKFKVRASVAGLLMSGSIGLSETSNALLSDLAERQIRAQKLSSLKEELQAFEKQRKVLKDKPLEICEKNIKILKLKIKESQPLTENMKKRLADLYDKKNNPELPTGVQTYLKDWLKFELYGRRQEIKSKYLDKGHLTEEEGFTLMCVQLGLGMVYKNEKRMEDDFFTGECDLHLKDLILDNKSSYSIATFPMFDTELPNEHYFYQMQVYMHLYGVEQSKVVYTLNNMPKEILLKELNWIFNDDEKQEKALNFIYTKEYFDEIKSDLFPTAKEIDFIEIPEAKRVKAFEVKKDEKIIAELKKRVLLSRNYLQKINK